MSCIEVRVSRVEEHLNGDIKAAIQHLNVDATSKGQHLQGKCYKICSIVPEKWLQLLSSDRLALYSNDGFSLIAK